MSQQALVLILEDIVLCVATVVLFWLDHPTAGAWALTALILNTVGVSWTPSEEKESAKP